MTKKAYLEAFAKGPCDPTIMLPGIGGSKLLVSIDCQVFQEKNP